MGWGYAFPIKGREINATVLFADISGFSTRTLNMSPAATLVYVQNFFAWITPEALHGRPGIIDKYIGDEVMVVNPALGGPHGACHQLATPVKRLMWPDAAIPIDRGGSRERYSMKRFNTSVLPLGNRVRDVTGRCTALPRRSCPQPFARAGRHR